MLLAFEIESMTVKEWDIERRMTTLEPQGSQTESSMPADVLR